MDNLKNLNFTELKPSEMKQVRGGDLLGELTAIYKDLADLLGISVEELLKRLGISY